MHWCISSLITTLVLFSLSAHASEGDAAWSFHVCVWRCNQTGCTDIPGRDPVCSTACPHLNLLPVPLALRITLWTCEDDCKHQCMLESEIGRRHETNNPLMSNQRGGGVASGSPAASPADTLKHIKVWKYYGKWPFRRVLGAQEIASCLLSLGNLIAHVHCCLGLVKLCVSRGYRPSNLRGPSRLKHQEKTPCKAVGMNVCIDSSVSLTQLGEGAVRAYPFLPMWLLYALVHINAWLMSAIFHIRDTWLTERLDYCSANIVVGLSLICVTVRALGVRQRAAAMAAVGSIIALVAWHLSYMLAIKFDYGWNMKFCLTLGLFNSASWVVFCQSTQHPHRWRLYRFLLLMYAALLLEVLDFPPFFMLFDAHALWHATTIPLVYLFYSFLHGDVEWVSALRQLRNDKILS